MNEYHRTLLTRARSVFADRPVNEVIKPTKAIIGVMTLPAAETDAQAALDKMQRAEIPTPKELAALEFMIRLMRPAPLSREGRLDDLPKYNNYNAEFVTAWATFREAVARHLSAIGRLDRADHQAMGTGFLIAEDLLVTNRHVLEGLSYGAGELQEGQAVVRFKQEWGSLNEDPVPIVESVEAHPTLDLAILRVKKTGARVPLVLETQPMTVGRKVAAVGYPFDDPVNNPVFRNIFESKFGVKRAAPGEIIGTSQSTLFHDCSTLGGNSGSPLVTLDTARVAGVHRSGQFMYRNEAVDGPSLQAFVGQFI